MRRLFFSLSVAMSFGCAFAHPLNPPDFATVADSDAVYVIRAEKPALNGVSFKVMETLRGPAKTNLVLNVTLGNRYLKTYATGSTWLIFHQPHGASNVIGWTIVGDCEWAPIEVTDQGSQQIAQGIGSIDRLKDYLAAHPYQQ